jgi:L-alanine-DL-glutamate epimerase-like enolase superfamily enzyme
MMITRILATEVCVPFRSGWTDSPQYGTSSWKTFSKWILEIQTADGLSGLGETPRGIGRAAVERIARHLTGRDVRSINLSQIMLPPGGDGYALSPADSQDRGPDWEYHIHDRTPFFGFEIALWDLIARRAGLPLFQILGGGWRDRVPMGFWIGRMTPSDAARQVAIAVEMGFRSLKMKAFPQDDIAGIVRAVRSAAGFTMPIVIDPNRKFHRFREALDIDYSLRNETDISYEDPFTYHPVEWREFRRATGRPLILHALAPGMRADPHRVAQDGACDYVNISPFSAREILTDAAIAARYGLLHWQGTGLDLGIIDAFLLHTSAAAQTACLPGDAIGHLLREDDLIEEQLIPVESAIPVPTAPGLGVTLDRRSMEAYRLDQMEFTLP